MDFTVHFGEGQRDFKGEDASYQINENGLLVVIEGGKRWQYSPTAWEAVEDAPPSRTMAGF